MKFVHPEFLWALFALAIPILVHLFHFRRHKKLHFSSLQFVEQVNQKTQSTQKLKHLLVLLARLLALASVIIAFAQPFFPKNSDSNGAQDEVVALHIDNSHSMTMTGTEGQLISEAREAAKKIIENAPINTKFLLSTNALSGIESQLTTKIDALERLDKISPIPMFQSFDLVTNWQKNAIENQDSDAKIRFVQLSDFQKNTTRFSRLSPDSTNSYSPILLHAENKKNLSIDSVWFRSPIRKKNVNNTLLFAVNNHSSSELNNIEVVLTVNEQQKSVFVDIPGNDTTHVEMNYTDKTTGFKQGKVQLLDQQFFSDDTYYFSYEVKTSNQILIVNGENTNPAISRILQLDDFNEVQSISINQYTGDLIASKDLVILNGLENIASGIRSDLLKFSTSKGTVAIIPSKKVDRASYNLLLSELNLPNFSDRIEQAISISKLNYEDNFFRGVFDKQKETIRLPGVKHYFNTSTAVKNQFVNIIEFQNQLPFLLRGNGAYSNFLFTAPLTDKNGSFTKDILFTTSILRIAELAKRDTPLSIILGEENTFPIYQLFSANSPVKVKGENVEFIPQIQKQHGVYTLTLPQDFSNSGIKAGNYFIYQDEQRIGVLSINTSRKESKLDFLTRKKVSQSIKNQGIKNVSPIEISNGTSNTSFEFNKANSVWKVFLLLSLLFLGTEMFLLKLWK